MTNEERNKDWRFPPLAKRDSKEPKMQIVKQPAVSSEIEKVLMQGDLSKLTSEQRVSYYNKTCETLGLNPLTRPFDYIRLNGKEVLYARKDATEQLRKLHGVSIKITKAEQTGGVFVVVAEAQDKTGRHDSSTGAVPVEGLKGDNLANALMKAETKAKRRVTLSICGLGILDETELETIAEVKTQRQEKAVQEPTPDQVHAVAYEYAHDGDAPVSDSQSMGDYVIKIGKKHRGETLSQVGLDSALSYVEWIYKDAKKTGKPISEEFQEFIRAVEMYQEEQESKQDMGDLPF